MQFIKFGLVGVLNTFVHLGVYFVAFEIIGLHYLIANTLGFLISVLNAYFWQRKFVFKTQEKGSFSQLIKVYSVYGCTFLLGSVTLFLMVELAGIHELLAPVINIAVTLPVNFLLNKFWAFRGQG